MQKIAQEFEDFIYINLEHRNDISRYFDDSLDIDNLITKLELKLSTSITTNTLIIIDEIQQNPRAVTSLKYFCEDKRYKVIAIGSNLGVTLFSNNSSFPVGKVDMIKLSPMSFNEFLIANNSIKLIDIINKACINNKMDSDFHNNCLEKFDLYTKLGGMPEVLSTYFETKSLYEARNVQILIVEQYTIDLIKYADTRTSAKLNMIYSYIETFLQEDNQKVKLSKIDKNGFSNLETAFSWLFSSHMTIPVYKISSVKMPLKSNMSHNNFKLFLNDTGLLISKSNYDIDNIQNQNDKIYFDLICYNYIATTLNKYFDTIFFYQKNKTEIDFVVEKVGKYIPIEVKSGTNTKDKSLQQFILDKNPSIAIKVSRKKFEHTNFINIPLYALEAYIIQLSECV